MKGEMKILIETEQRSGVSSSGQVVDEWYQACHSPVAILSPAAAAMLAGVRTFSVDRWLEAGLLHGVETALRFAYLPELNRLNRSKGDSYD